MPVTILAPLALLLALCSPAAAETLQAVALRVTDGDTIKVELQGPMPELFRRQSVRLRHCDTPEKIDPRPEIAALARQATAFTAGLVPPGAALEIQDAGFDKYGGRLLGRIVIDGQDLCEALKAGGLARGYEGGKKEW